MLGGDTPFLIEVVFHQIVLFKRDDEE